MVENSKQEEDLQPNERGILIPREFTQIFKNNPHSPENRIAAIKKLIQENPGKILTMDDFREAAQTAIAGDYVRDLIKEGFVVRHKAHDGVRGHRYLYAWVDKSSEPQVMSFGDITVDLPGLPLTEEEYNKIDQLVDRYYSENKHLEVDKQLGGVLLFRQWLKNELDSALSKRKKAIFGTEDSNEA